MWRWTFIKWYTFIFNGPMEFFCNSNWTLINLPFFRKLASVDTSQLQMYSCHSPVVAGNAKHIIVNRLVHLFRHTTSGGFPYGSLECGKCDTSHLPISSKNSPPPEETRKSKTFKQYKTRKRCKTTHDWSGKRWVEIRRWLVLTSAVFLPL